MPLTELNKNLRRLRTARKLSQVQVAEAAGLSREGYRRIEDGLGEPKTDSLERIATALGVDVTDLFREVRELQAVRFRAQKRMTTREDLLAQVARWLDDYSDLEHLLGQSLKFKLAPLARELSGDSHRDPREAAARARQALGLKEGELIRDICGLLEDNGVKVFTPSVASEGFFGLSVAAKAGGPAVIVNRWERISVERWIFTAAHELGHILMHLHAYDVEQAEENDEEEVEANLFATHFLMPEATFDEEWREARGLGFVERVFKVKRIFRVSWKTVVYRIAARSEDPSRVWAQFYIAYKRQHGISLRATEEPEGLGTEIFGSSGHWAAPVPKVADEPEHLSPCDFVEDRLRRLVRVGVEEGRLTVSRAAEVLGTDVETMRRLRASWLE